MPVMFDRESLKSAGFQGFYKITDTKNTATIPKEHGIYLVVRDVDSPEFNEKSPAGWFKGRNPTVEIEKLEDNWVDDAFVIYIGKATNLCQRISQYIRFGAGAPIGHWGGRYIWQLKGHDELEIAYKVLPTEYEPRTIEKEMINDFRKIFGKRPFANLSN